jgi:hypothetical protein
VPTAHLYNHGTSRPHDLHALWNFDRFYNAKYRQVLVIRVRCGPRLQIYSVVNCREKTVAAAIQLSHPQFSPSFYKCVVDQ